MHEIGIIAVSAAVTMLIRFFPFLVLGRQKQTPKILQYLSDVLPCAAIAMLVVYCLRNTDFLSGSHGIPEMLSAGVVILTYVWKKNTLISIISGTLLYMFLVQKVF